MIINLKHFKEQWSVIPSFGTTYLKASSPNPCKVLLALTAVQLWLQLLSLLLLLISYLDQWYFTKDYNSNLTGLFAEYEKANFIGSMILHAIDIIVTIFATCHLRNASTMTFYRQPNKIAYNHSRVYVRYTPFCAAVSIVLTENAVFTQITAIIIIIIPKMTTTPHSSLSQSTDIRKYIVLYAAQLPADTDDSYLNILSDIIEFPYNNLEEIRTWKVLNNIYLMTSIMFFVYIFSNSRSLVICLRVIMTCMFAAFKVYIVYHMYRNKKSSNLVLEQNAVLIKSSPKPTSNANLASSESNHSHVVMVELETTVNTPEVKEDKGSKASETVSEKIIVQ